MIDYNATLDKFFEETIKWLEKRAKNAKDTRIHQQVLKSIGAVRTIAANPMKYSDYVQRVQAGLEESVGAGFMAGTNDNNVYLIYNKVLHHMGKLNSDFDYEREEAQKVLLNATKAIKYKNSTNILKDFYYPFMSSERFAVKAPSKEK